MRRVPRGAQGATAGAHPRPPQNRLCTSATLFFFSFVFGSLTFSVRNLFRCSPSTVGMDSTRRASSDGSRRQSSQAAPSAKRPHSQRRTRRKRMSASSARRPRGIARRLRRPSSGGTRSKGAGRGQAGISRLYIFARTCKVHSKTRARAEEDSKIEETIRS